MSGNEFELRPTGGGVGAFVDGVDLSEKPSKSRTAALRKAVGEYGVLFFREQDLSPERHIALAERFGAINVNRFFAAVDGYPAIAQVSKEPDQKANIGGGWHTDHTYDEAPAMGSILVARETPPQGGDTLFASMYSAYDALSEGLKQSLEGLNALHSSRHAFGPNATYKQERRDVVGRLGNEEAATQDSIHPVVIRHPISGHKALFVNPAFTTGIEGWSTQESAPFLEMLYAQARRPEHAYRFQWAPGSVAFWVNRATWHYALNDYHGDRRLMHRITIEGDRLAD